MPGKTPPPPPVYPKVTVLLGDPKLPDESKIGHVYSPEDLEAVELAKAALAELTEYRFTYHNDHTKLIADLLAQRPDFVLNFCDTGYRNDARRELHVPALLELLDIPYSGSGPTCLGMCYDKALVRAVAAAHGIPVPAEVFFDNRSDRFPEFAYPAFIKPNRGDGSLGITEQSFVRNQDEARAYLARLRRELPGREVLIQEFLSGNEYGLGLIGNPGRGFTALPMLEVDYSNLDPSLPRILSYGSKVDPESPYWTDLKYHAAALDEATQRRLAGYAEVLFERLGFRDYGRFDFRADSAGEIKLMEVNPNPAWCSDGKLNFMAGFAGMRYSELLGMMLEAAQGRYSA